MTIACECRAAGRDSRTGAPHNLPPSTLHLPPTRAIHVRRSGFTLAELLVAMFVLTMAVAGAVAVIVAAGRSSSAARDKLLAEELGRTALADALYAAELYRSDNAEALDFGAAPFNASPYEQKTADSLGPAGCEKHGDRDPGAATDLSYGWVWRAHSFDPAIGAYSLDIWVFRNPAEADVNWGQAANADAKRQNTLLYLQTRLEARKR